MENMQWLGIDFDAWIKLASLFGTFVAWTITQRRRPRLEAFFTHGAAHKAGNAQPPVAINTHSLVVRNSGSRSATNVRVVHAFFPNQCDIQVWPPHPYQLTPVGPAGNEFLFERIRPQEQLVLSYLYPGPTTLDQFQTHVRFDEGFATFFPIAHVRVIPKWLRILIYYFFAAGFCLTLYFAIKTLVFFFALA